MPAEQPIRKRARELGLPLKGKPGPLNAITDVPGLSVGLTTLISGEGNMRSAPASRPSCRALRPICCTLLGRNVFDERQWRAERLPLDTGIRLVQRACGDHE